MLTFQTFMSNLRKSSHESQNIQKKWESVIRNFLSDEILDQIDRSPLIIPIEQELILLGDPFWEDPAINAKKDRLIGRIPIARIQGHYLTEIHRIKYEPFPQLWLSWGRQFINDDWVKYVTNRWPQHEILHNYAYFNHEWDDNSAGTIPGPDRSDGSAPPFNLRP